MMWQRTSLANIATVFNGKTPSKDEQRSAGHPVLKIRDVSTQEGFCGLFQAFVDETYAIKFREKLLKAGDLLVLNAAHNADYVASKMYRVEESVIGALPTGEWLVIRPNEDIVDPAFVWNWLQDAGAKRLLRDLVKGIHLYPKDVERLELYLPPLAEQKRIAAILDKADSVRRKRQDAIKLTEELLRSAFLEMFGDPVANPKGWPIKPLSEFGNITTGNTPSRERSDYYGDDLEWVKSDNINTRAHVLTQAVEGLSKLGRTVARTASAGSTLITCIAGSPDCIGNVGLANREVAFNQQINAITPSPNIDSRFLYGMLLVGKRLIQVASTSSMKGMVSKGRLESVAFPCPSLQPQRRFGKFFDRVLHMEESLTLAAAADNEMFEALVHRAFKGELTSVGGELLVPAQVALARNSN